MNIYYFEPEKPNTINYIGISTFLHIAAFILTVFIKVSAPEIKKPEIIEFEMIPAAGQIMPSPSLGSEKAALGSPAAQIIKSNDLVSSDEIITKAVSRKASAKSKVARSNAKSYSKPYVPQFQIKKVDFETVETTEPAPEVPIDHSESLAAIQSDLREDQMSKVFSDTEISDSENEKAMEEVNRLNGEAEQFGNALISEQQAEINRKAGAAHSKAKAWGQAQRGQIAKMVRGQGGQNGGQGGTREGAPRGLPNGVRRLGDIRQMPGNRKPSYSFEDRKNLKQGDVVFYAYISKSGVPLNFKLIKSTGFDSLDERTLAALKTWRFYPGQEGWVELPFNWSLRGSKMAASN